MSWQQFKRGKLKKQDVQHFDRHIEDELFALQEALSTQSYQHGHYQQFYVLDPQRRYISKASVRDRVVHQLLYTTLSTIFGPTFFFHSYSCREGKGTHAGVTQLHKILRKVSKNGTVPCFALKMDIQRFFDSVDHHILKQLLQKRIQDPNLSQLTEHVIDSFTSDKKASSPIGLPLGNVTSQLFANVYLHPLDHFVKHTLRQPYYLRYCDDFILVANHKEELLACVTPIQSFLAKTLKLNLHPRKIILRKLAHGIDFLGYVLFLHHRVLRTTTRRRMQRKLKEKYTAYLKGQVSATHMDQSLQSYLGILKWANAHELSQHLKNAYWIRPYSASEDPSP